MIFAERKRNVLLLVWIHIFGWIFAGEYLMFRKRVKFLRSIRNNIFDDEAIIKKTIDYLSGSC
jgi:hypothetical protein